MEGNMTVLLRPLFLHMIVKTLIMAPLQIIYSGVFLTNVVELGLFILQGSFLYSQLQDED